MAVITCRYCDGKGKLIHQDCEPSKDAIKKYWKGKPENVYYESFVECEVCKGTGVIKIKLNHERLKKEIRGYIGSIGGILMRHMTVKELRKRLKKSPKDSLVEGYEGEDTGLTIWNEDGTGNDFISTHVKVRKTTEKDAYG